MTPEEQKMLDDLATKVAQAPPASIDPEADQLIRSKIGSRPDALYVLTQTVLIQSMAIDQAHQQIQDLQQRLAQQPQQPTPAPGSGFLPQSPGGPPRGTPWTVPGYSAPPPPPPPATPAYSTPPSYQQPVPSPYPSPYQAPAPVAPPSGGHSFLKTAAITAGGIAAGALAFEGIKSLFSHPNPVAVLGGGGIPGVIPGGFGGGYGGGLAPGLAPGMAPGETIVNNYYDSPQRADDTLPPLRDDIDDRSSFADDPGGSLDDDSGSSLDDDSGSVDDSSYSDSGSSGDDFA